MEPSDTRDEIEEYSLSVPIGMQRDILICHQLVSMQEGEPVGIIGVSLVGIGLPEKGINYFYQIL